MFDRRELLIGGGALAASLASTARAQAAPRIGIEAPGFELTDSNGKKVSLQAFRGKTVVLEWTNPECPYVRKHYVGGNMQGLQRAARDEGVVWLALSSMAPGKNGYVDGLEANAWLDEQKAAPTSFLLDPDGHAATAYGVVVALSMFVIDRDGRLFYSGAIDDKPTANPKDIAGARNYIKAALAAVKAGERMTPAATRAYGCLAR